MTHLKFIVLTTIILSSTVIAGSCTKQFSHQRKYLDEAYVWSAVLSESKNMSTLHYYFNESVISYATSNALTIKYPEETTIELPSSISLDHHFALTLLPRGIVLVGSLNELYLLDSTGKLIDRKMLSQIPETDFAYFEISDLIPEASSNESIKCVAYDLNADDNSYIQCTIKIANDKININTIERNQLGNYRFLGRGLVKDNRFYILVTPDNDHHSLMLKDVSSDKLIECYKDELLIFDNVNSIVDWKDDSELLAWSQYVAIGDENLIFPIMDKNQRSLVFQKYGDSEKVVVGNALRVTYSYSELNNLLDAYKSVIGKHLGVEAAQ